MVDLVLVHELCHLRAAGHGAAFRREVRLTLPDADALERWFADEEPHLWRGAVRPRGAPAGPGRSLTR
ncbi:YgjP-like metallopeptidase domain-containing protein [Streptomyces sp. NPDC087658]|uniref:YgjP-like metallopeptidase domain-containing protein n=1 Tax=Streptomyces sp. NPDC087658 TaxID=3365800 RepID=UPI00380E5CCC